MEAKKSWEKIHKRLLVLDEKDSNESEVLAEAYEALLEDYRESRELNKEMEAILHRQCHPHLYL